MQEEITAGQPASTPVLLPPIRAMLDGYGYRYAELDESTLYFALRSPRALHHIYFMANEDVDRVRVIGVYGSHVPPDRRPAVAELLARLNWQMSIGSYEMDFADGEVRYRIGMDLEGSWMTEKMADNLLGYALNALDRRHDAVMRVAFADADPEAASIEVP